VTAAILDGKKLAETVRSEVKLGVDAFVKEHGRPPGLEVILVGEDPASQVYTRNKEKAAKEVGIRGRLHTLPAATSEADLLALIARLNADDTIDGILVQLPLPKHLGSAGEHKVLDAVSAAKDVDGFHPMNVGLLASGRPGLVPCTPLGCMRLLQLAAPDLKGARAVVVGRSNIVGKPVAQLLLAEHATVTIAHSRTKDLEAVCREADVLVAAVGKAEMIHGHHVRPGAIVIDVGINRVRIEPPESGPATGSPEGGTPEGGKTRLVGDVKFSEAVESARAITPVPGGVGPMTIAYLLQNTLTAARARIAASRA
jgi:methylenetetrahydrofolate dehydrogenase (NADP+) / methenyltetrahydrofolate cyclohydrolase